LCVFSADKHDKGKDDKKDKNKEAAKQEQVPAADGDEAGSDHCVPLTEEEKKEKRLEDGIGIPHLVLECRPDDETPVVERVIESRKLASVEEVMDGLGLGPHGPPIPPAAIFGVVPFPVKRHAPPGADNGHYMFIASGPDDP
jgi:hydrocephalus-inducing protein